MRAEVTGRTSRKPSMIEAKNGEVPSLVLLGIGASTEDDIENRKSHHELEHEALHASGEDHDHHHDHDEFESFVLKLGAIKDPSDFIDRLKPVIEKHDILRLKGFIDVPGKPMRLSSRPSAPASTPISTAPGQREKRETRIVVIGLHEWDFGSVVEDVQAAAG